MLVIEDNPDIRDSLSELLVALGHEVEVAANGPSGVKKFLEARPDVALIDVGLPGIDGYEVAKQIRASDGGSTAYLVALTGYGGPEARQQAAAAGFDDHVLKPLRLDTLNAILQGRARFRPIG